MHSNLKWQTKVKLPSYPFEIGYRDKIMALGSCFAEHMSARLQALHYQVMLTPFGIQYNPASIGQGLERLLAAQNIQAEELVQHQGLWHSWMHHGSYSKPQKAAALSAIQLGFEAARQHLMQTDYLLITLGTSWVYRLKTGGQLVNNCHKFPAKHFRRQALSISEIIASLGAPIVALKAQRPKLKILATVSPVRHLKDGAIENQRSKARLLLAMEQLEQEIGDFYYFPAYEIMMDELRDYRFYQEDLTHPAALAREYIWQCLEEHCLAASEAPWRKRVQKLMQALAHRPLHPERAEHQQFLQRLLKQLEGLQAELPKVLDWQIVRAQIENQILAID